MSSDRRDSLGGERAGVPVGPQHRGGQPCTWCHNGSYEVEFALAGTIFATLDGTRPVAGARVELTDATGRTRLVQTNCAGNFYIYASDWRPSFPVRTTVTLGTQTQKMETLIQRESSCSACHMRVVSQTSPGVVFLFTDNAPTNVLGGCR